ncbi:MAG: RDD family protein [Bacteroidetes bacterium]|nr:RDD family protein [Bacteroidota bacterium]
MELEAVSKGIRSLNYILDMLFVRLALMRMIIVPLLDKAFPSLFTSRADFSWLYLAISIVIYFLYYFVSEATTGMTVGKLLTQTIVVTDYGERPTTRTFLFRTLWRFVPFEVLSWFAYAGWHDTQTGTTVVSKSQWQAFQEQQSEEELEAQE